MMVLIDERVGFRLASLQSCLRIYSATAWTIGLSGFREIRGRLTVAAALPLPFIVHELGIYPEGELGFRGDVHCLLS